MPTFVLYKNGKKVERIEGASKDRIVKAIADHK